MQKRSRLLTFYVDACNVISIMKSTKKTIQRLFSKHPWFWAGICFCAFVFLCIFIIFIFEHKIDHTFTWFDAFKIVFVFLSGEYGDEPKSSIAKILAFIIFMIGVCISGAIIGKFSSLFVNLKREVKMPVDLKSHIVICNWNMMGDKVIRELHSPVVKPKREILVITQTEINEEELRLNPEYEKVFFLRSDPTAEQVLKHACVEDAHSVILLCDEVVADPDAQNALIALAISAQTQKNKHKPWIIAELKDPKRESHLKVAGVNEWICASDYALGIIAQCALEKGLSTVYSNLLKISDDTNETYIITEYPEEFIGKNFQELTALINKNRSTETPYILIGIKSEGEVILNPRKNSFDKLKTGDALIVISFDQPRLGDS